MRFAVVVLVVACSSVMTSAVAPSPRQYDVIPSRNVFGLRAPENTPAPEPPPVNLPPIYLTGITTMLGYKQALLRTQIPAKNGQPAQEESLILAEGQRENGIEVLRIDEHAGQVSILNSGSRMTLNFDRNGIQSKGNPGASTILAQNGGATNRMTYRLLPSRTPRVGYASATNAIAAPIPSPVGYSSPYLYSRTNLPSGAVSVNDAGAASVAVPPHTAPAPSSLTPQEQLVLSELQRAAAMEALSRQNQNSTTPTALPPMPDSAIPGPVRPAIPPFPPTVEY